MLLKAARVSMPIHVHALQNAGLSRGPSGSLSCDSIAFMVHSGRISFELLVKERFVSLMFQFPSPDEQLLSNDALDAELAVNSARSYVGWATQALGCSGASPTDLPTVIFHDQIQTCL